MDLIEALDHLDEEYIQNARNFQRTAPLWIRWTSLAACVCCLLLVGSFSLHHILTRTEEVSPAPEALTSVAFSIEDCEIVTSETGVSMAVPTEYLDYFSVDVAYEHTVEEEQVIRNLVFAFNDEYNRYTGGFVWGIYVQSADEWSARINEGKTEFLDSRYCTAIGRDGDQVYTLAYYSPLLDKNKQYEPESYESTFSYYQHMVNGLLMLEDFLARNKLEPVDEWWDWQDYYERKLLNPLEVQLVNLGHTEDNTKVLLSEYYGVAMEVPSEYADEFIIDTCFTSSRAEIDILNDMAFGFFDHANQATEGFAWGIYAHFSPEVWTHYVESGSADKDYTFDYTVLGERENQTCVLVYYPTDPANNSFLQYDPTSYESVSSYYAHLVAGYEALEDFVERNELTKNDTWGDWRVLYRENMLKPLEDLLEEMEPESAAEKEHTPLLWKYSGELEIRNCVDYSEDGAVMNMFDPISREIMGYDTAGIIWWIETLSYEEFELMIEEDPVAEPYEDGWYGWTDPSGFVYARDNDYYYILNTPTDLRYDPLNQESNTSFLIHMEEGLNILEWVIKLNDLTINPHWGTEIEKTIFQEIFPSIVRDDSLPDYQYTISTFSTVLTEDESRNTNISLACEEINNLVVYPGQTFSFINTLERLAPEDGYQVAAVYPGGVVETMVGGGVSQLASTLYYTCLYADVDVLERSPHAFKCSYIPGGMDAAIYWETGDFRFRNNMETPILISAYVSGTRVFVSLTTTEEPDFYVKVGTSCTKIIPYDTCTYETEGMNREGQDGGVYTLVRYVYDSNNLLIRKDTTEYLDALGGLGTTTYSALTGEIYTGG